MKIQVLIVEDDGLVLDRFSRAIRQCPELELAGTATTLRAAEDFLRRHSVDVVLVDLGLPDGSGIELIRRARAKESPPECMVVTMYADERHVLGAIEAGATGYILKDSLESDISESVCELIRGGSPISPMIARALLTRFPKRAMLPMGFEPLTDREVEVLEQLSLGYKRSEIAERMRVSVHTIHAHVKHIYEKLAVHSSTEAVHRARRAGLID